MRESIVCGCGIMVAALVIGCGSRSSAEAVIKEQLSIQAQMTGIMEKVTDKQTYEEARVKINELSKRSKDLEKGFTEDQLKLAAEKFKRESEASFKKYEAAFKRVLKILFEAKPPPKTL